MEREWKRGIPITLLNVMGKLYEGLIRNRLVSELEDKEGIHIHQYGFRAGRSTLQAVERIATSSRRTGGTWNLLMTFDIRNAFNAVSWGVIMKKLEDRGVFQYLRNITSNYLKEHTIQCGSVKMDVTAGVPQGSVLGPTLWNVAYDDVLRLELDGRTEITAYADDLAVTIAADNIGELNRKIRRTVNRIVSWVEEHHLTLAPQKTEAVILKGPRKRDGILIRVMGEDIQILRQAKYLGVVIDTQRLFGQHVSYAVKKAERRVTALSKLMPNIGGPGSSKRQVLMSVAHSTLMYGAPIWHGALRVERYRQMVESLQRKMLLRVASAYRTASAQALQVITGTPPAELLVRECAATWGTPAEDMKEAKRRVREETMTRWQLTWDSLQDKARWTRQLIPSVSAWVDCKHRSCNYFLTQFLMGHGSFRTYTLRIGKATGDECIYCGQRDSPEHTVCACPRWNDIRRAEWGELAVNAATDVVEQMTASPRNWRIVTKGIKRIMENKEREERAHQQGNFAADDT